MTRCLSCLIPTTRPDTEFTDGMCSACISFADRQRTDWDARRLELIELLDRYDGRCIVASSGGKDSHYQALTLLNMGAKVTVVTATTCHETRIGRKNIENLARYATTIQVTPNRTTRAKLNKLGLQVVGDISWPEHAAIFSAPFRVALAQKTPLVFYGECPQNQYGGPKGTEHAKRMTARWVSEFGGFLGMRTDDLTDIGDMSDYELPDGDVEAYFLGQFLPWDSHENAAVAKRAGMIQELPCPANYWAAENLDNAHTGLHDHMMYRKYGYGRGAAQLSVDIRAGLVSREYGLEWVRANDGLFPYWYAGVSFAEVCDGIGLTEDEVMKIMDDFTNWDLFSHVDDRRPILKAA